MKCHPSQCPEEVLGCSGGDAGVAVVRCFAAGAAGSAPARALPGARAAQRRSGPQGAPRGRAVERGV